MGWLVFITGQRRSATSARPTVQGEYLELFLSVSFPVVTQNSGSVIGDTVVEIK